MRQEGMKTREWERMRPRAQGKGSALDRIQDKGFKIGSHVEVCQEEEEAEKVHVSGIITSSLKVTKTI